MAFATKYRLKSVSDVFGGFEIDFQKDGYAGSVIELPGVAPNAATLKIGRNSQNIFEPILEGELEALWPIEDDTDTLELATDEPRTWLAIVKQQGSGDEIWRGWVQPESYQEQYTAQPYQVSVKATDGLSELKASKFVIGTGKDSLFDFLRQAVDVTGLSLPYKESINIYDTAMNSTAADSPLVQAEAEFQSFISINNEPNNYQALAEVLRPFRARIFQWAGHWYIENTLQKRGNYVERIYNAAGVYQSNSTVNPLVVLDKSMPDFRALIGQSGAINTVPNINQARVFFKSTAQEATGGIPGFSLDSDWADSANLVNWTKTGSFSILKTGVNLNVDGRENENGVTLLGRQTTLGANYIQSQDYAVTVATFGELTIGFQYLLDWPSISILGSRPILYFEIVLDAGVNTYYWKNGWTTSTERNPLQAQRRERFEAFQTVISEIPEDGDIFIRFYQPVKTGSEGVTKATVTDWRFETQSSGEVTAGYAVESGILSFLSDLTPYDENIYFADGDNADQAGALSVAGTKTSSWNRRGETDGITLQRLALLQFLSLYQRPSLRLQGTLYQQGEQIAPWNVIQDNASVSTRKYVMNAFTLGLSNGQGQVLYRELITTDAAPTYVSDLFQGQFDFNWTSPIQLPFGPGVIPSLPDFDFNLNGDTFGPIGTNTLSKSAIVEKPVLDITTPPTSSEIVINAVQDVSDSLPMTKISAKDFIINAYASKDNALEEDRLVISDSEDSDELKVIEIIETQKASVYLVKNQTGGTLLKGKAARAVGVLGASGRILADYAIADGTHLPKFTIGIIYKDIPDGEDGYVMAFGQIRQVNTNAFNEGDVLWLSPTSAGELTATKPTAPDYKVILALVTRKDAVNGTLQIRVNVGEFLTDLHDVTNGGNTGDALVKQSSGLYEFAAVKPSDLAQDGATDGEVLTWNNTAGQWEPAAGGGGGGGDTVTGDLTRGIEVTEPTAGNKVIAKKYYNVFESFTSSMALELKEGRRHIFAATSDFTLANPTNVESFDGRVEIVITQGLGGGHQITAKGDRVIFPNGTIPTLNGVFGESDWLRGICVNGYLLIYQIESLAAPGIDVEPPPQPPAEISDFLHIFSFVKENATLDVVGDYAIQNSGSNDFKWLSKYIDVDDIYNTLKGQTPIAAWINMLITTSEIVNQADVSESYTHRFADNTQKYSLNGRNLVINNINNSTGNAPATSINGKSTLAIYCVFKLIPTATTGPRRIVSIGRNTQDSNQKITLFKDYSTGKFLFTAARQNETEVTITGTTDWEDGKLYLLTGIINAGTGDFSFNLNGVQEATGTLFSTGNFDFSGSAEICTTTNALQCSFYDIRTSEKIDNVADVESYLIDLYGIASTTTKTGQDIYELFDVIVSPDRYNYSPYAANIRESTTNAEKVISHDNTTGLFDTTAFDTHVGAGNGFVTTMVNQATPWLSFIQTTAARQPQMIKNAFGSRVGFQFNRAARRSIQNLSLPINVNSLHYNFFIVLNANSHSGGNNLDTFFALYRGASLRLLLAVQTLNATTAPIRLRVSHAFSGSIVNDYSTNEFLLNTPYLLSVKLDYENGVMEARMNQALWINNTSLPTVTSVNSADDWCLGNIINNNPNAYNGILGSLFYHEGELTSAQRIAIETELMNTYVIT